MNFVNRIGTFLIFLGILMVALFVLSDIARAPTCNFLAVGAVSLGLGVFLWLRDPPSAGPPPQRFRTVKKIFTRKPRKKK